MANTYDERDRQGKALDRWEQQQKMWARLQANLARKVGKDDPAATLPGSIHHFRMRQEESTLLDASVPPEVKSGHHAWEMNLRNYDTNATGRAGGGFRYVQFGVPYPYPLYVPVRDGVSTDPESNTLTRVLIDHVAPRSRPIADSQYFHQRKAEYKKHIKKIFSHFIPGQEGLVIQGGPPPLTGSKEEADGLSEECFQPVVFYPALPPKAVDAKSPTPPPSESSPRERESAPSRASIAPSELTTTDEKKTTIGPALTISAASLVAKVRPGELAQLTLCASNAGSTAIFYQWAAREKDPVPGLVDKAASTFDMADLPTGVLLPGDQKLFTFSFRPLHAGSFSQTMDLNTVPAGKERILVHLQVFAISEDENPAATKAIEQLGAQKAVAHELANILWGPVGDSTLAQSALRSTTRMLDDMRRRPETQRNDTIATQKCNWTTNNNLSSTTLPAAACPFRESFAHQLQVAKDGRSSATLFTQPTTVNFTGTDGPHASGNAAIRAAHENPANNELFAAHQSDIPYHPLVYGKIEALFGQLQHFKGQCTVVKTSAINLEPHPPAGASPEGRPKSGGAKALQQQQERELAAAAAAPHTPRKPSLHGRFSLGNILAPSTATVAIMQMADPQQAVVLAQEQCISRAVKAFEGNGGEQAIKGARSAPQAPASAVAAEVLATPIEKNVRSRSSSPLGLASTLTVVLPPPPPVQASVPAAPLVWDGSLRMLLEEISQIRDSSIRNNFQNAAQLLLRAAAATEGGESEELSLLIERLAVEDTFAEVSEAVSYFEHTAKDLVGGRNERRTAVDPKDKGKGAAGKKVATNKAARPPSADGRGGTIGLGGATDDAVKFPSTVEAFYAGAGNIYDSVGRQIQSRRERYLGLIASTCDQPVAVTHQRRLELIRLELLAPHADVDTVVEPPKKKR
eukprot:GILI01017589.1.p1 GENE.GILI01017589.1~~GILI01017589.1.p1  ORF type:complete len:916 (-),score=166.59 GILI01017589.1:41-2788(-)